MTAPFEVPDALAHDSLFSGVGRAVSDIMRHDGRRVLAVTITGGKLVRRAGDNVMLPKEALLAPLVAAIEG